MAANIRVLKLAPALVCLNALCLFSLLYGQQATAPQNAESLRSFSAIQGQYDQGLAIPQFIPVSGWRQDSTALTEINNYRSQVGVQAWATMTGQGNIRYGNDQSVQGQATLEISQPAKFRLDSELSDSSTISIRREGDQEAVSRGAATPKGVDVRDAAAGILVFPRLQEAAFPKRSDIVLDDGTATVDGQRYHRITLESPPSSMGNSNSFDSWIAIDLYFNPTTHLLMKSANIVHSVGSTVVMVRVVSYDNYQKNGAALIPLAFRETLNGQLAWTLQMSQLSLNGSVNSQDFIF